MVVAGAVAVAVVVTVAEGRMNEETSWLHASLNSSHRSSGIFRTRARNQSMYAALSSLRSTCNCKHTPTNMQTLLCDNENDRVSLIEYIHMRIYITM